MSDAHGNIVQTRILEAEIEAQSGGIFLLIIDYRQISASPDAPALLRWPGAHSPGGAVPGAPVRHLVEVLEFDSAQERLGELRRLLGPSGEEGCAVAAGIRPPAPSRPARDAKPWPEPGD
jgi:hypothetical protein